MDEKLKSVPCKKSSFLNGGGGEVIYTSDDWLVKLMIIIIVIIIAPLRSQIFKNFKNSADALGTD